MSFEGADFIVVGSGAAGATAAMVLAEAGRDVLVLEEGPHVRDEDRGLGPDQAFARLFREGGAQVAMGRSVIPVLQGRAVGGTTVVNGGIIWRLPEDAYHRAFRSIGGDSALPLAEFEKRFDIIEKDLRVSVTPDDRLGNNGLLMRKACEKLELRAHAIRRNIVGCEGSSRCLEACPTKRKQSMEVTYLPRAEKKGARILSDFEVVRVLMKGDRAVGVLGRTKDGAEVTIPARIGVILAASAVQSPAILMRSKVGSPEHTGAHFRAHPGTAVTGIYPDPVRIWEGGAQTYEVDHYRTEGFKIETVSLPLELAGVRIPGFGRKFAERMNGYPHAAVWGVQVRAEAEGRVRPQGRRTHISYTPTERDMSLFMRGVQVLCRMHFAAGAEIVYPGVHGGPDLLTSPDQLKQLEGLPRDPTAYGLMTSHVFSTCRMSRDERSGVVDFNGAVHGVRGLWVLDAAALPTNLGVNPQHTIMAFAMMASERLSELRG